MNIVRFDSPVAAAACGALAPQADDQERPRAPSIVATPPTRTSVDHDRAVLPGRRVVVEAEQQHLVDGVPIVLVRRLDSAEPEVARRELDAVEVARRARPSGVSDHDAARVRELLDLVVVGVAEADRVGRAARSLPASPVRKCQPAARLRALVALEVRLLLLRGERRRLPAGRS